MGKAEALRTALTSAGARVGRPFRGAADALLAALLAPLCAGCRATLESPLNGPVCGRCLIDAHLAEGRYDGALREIIHAFKYEGRRSLAQPLGTLLRQSNSRALEDAACVVPVPLFAGRKLRRGFNQATELAKHLDLPVVHALWRVRVTASQTGLTAIERRRNVHRAFRLSPFLSKETRLRCIADRVVVLVDDVMTTGATSEACASVLLDAGAREVRVVTLARAPLQRPT